MNLVSFLKNGEKNRKYDFEILFGFFTKQNKKQKNKIRNNIELHYTLFKKRVIKFIEYSSPVSSTFSSNQWFIAGKTSAKE